MSAPTGPTCIVCGKPIKKKTSTVYFKKATDEKPHGTREQPYTYSREIYLDEKFLPRTKKAAIAHVNETVVSVQYSHDGRVYSVGAWDGESYEDRFFHSGECAQKQGYASAQHGERYTWKKK